MRERENQAGGCSTQTPNRVEKLQDDEQLRSKVQILIRVGGQISKGEVGTERPEVITLTYFAMGEDQLQAKGII